METIRFLDATDVLVLHEETIAIEGGLAGVRDRGLLESAVAMPRAQFGGAYLHHDLFEMAAAYLFHLAGNHPFHDGNKRAAIISALVFLRENGYACTATNDELEAFTLTVARGEADKPTLAAFSRERATPR